MIKRDNDEIPTKSMSTRIIRCNKRKKINHTNKSMTSIKCQRHNNNNYRWITTTEGIEVQNETSATTTKATRLIASLSTTNNRTNLSQTSLITNHQDNNKNKSVIMKNSNDDKLIDDSIGHHHKRLAIRSYFSCYQIKPLTLTLLLTIGILINVNLSCGFTLDGTQNSFAQFRKWYSGLNGSLELELKTEQPNGLVLYTDDGGTYDFFELKLVEGVLRLRYNLGGGAQIITVGRDLHDGHWHKVQVS
jgi:hypothetical protein